MPAVALLNDKQQLLGFMLIATDDVLDFGGQTDAILTGVPSDASLLDTPLCRIIQEHKNKEYQLAVKREQGGIALAMSLNSDCLISLKISESGKGIWSVQEGKTNLTGTCEFCNS